MGHKSQSVGLIPEERVVFPAGNLLGTRPRPLGLFSFMERTSPGSILQGFGLCRAAADLSKRALIPHSVLSAACLGVSWDRRSQYLAQGQVHSLRSQSFDPDQCSKNRLGYHNRSPDPSLLHPASN